jgi:hypothetical protein
MRSNLRDYMFWCIFAIPVGLLVLVIVLGVCFGIYPSGSGQ